MCVLELVEEFVVGVCPSGNLDFCFGPNLVPSSLSFSDLDQAEELKNTLCLTQLVFSLSFTIIFSNAIHQADIF